jgi:predicted nucleotidyltransferase component of viral defense system
MSEQILENLKIKIEEELGGYKNAVPAVKLNKAKEVLQDYVLNFIYHHPDYSNWIMYGGSALRKIHGLDRMSVDLDFEIPDKVDEKLLGNLKKNIEDYFADSYGADSNFLTVKIDKGRGLLLKFRVGKELNLGAASDWVHVKVDLNHFVAPKTVTERRPINRNQFSFVILVYNMSALMASKLAAIFLRGQRGVGSAIYEEKGRDIYDLLWYMGKKIIPDFDYLLAKDVDVKNPQILFDKLTLQMNKVNDDNLKNDLSPLFIDQSFITNWLLNWRESYLRLLDDYQINTITNLARINIHHSFQNDNFWFTLTYNTENGKSVKVRYIISDYWIIFREGDLSIKIDDELSSKIAFTSDGLSSSSDPENKLIQYAALFYKKTEDYLKKTNKIILGDSIITKVIRMTADNLNPKEEILLNKSALIHCELEDLLR